MQVNSSVVLENILFVITFRPQRHQVYTKLRILQVLGPVYTHLSNYYMRSIIL
jgi:hypothetical protein